MEKSCEGCGKIIERPTGRSAISAKRWEARRFCRACGNQAGRQAAYAKSREDGALPDTKTCEDCGVDYARPRGSSRVAHQRWLERRLCRKCANRRGRLAAAARRHETFEERFWQRVEKTDGCWLWTQACAKQGYGVVWRVDKLLLAHRVAYELLVGPAEGMQLHHVCGVRNCVRPDHLEAVTQLEHGKLKSKKWRRYRVVEIDAG